MPTTAMQDMCDSFCATYSNGGLFTISNCSLR
jgi:hypothetical protein